MTQFAKRLNFTDQAAPPNRPPPDFLQSNLVRLDDAPGSPTYRITLRWAPLAASWYLTLATTTGAIIVSGARVSDRTDCLLGVSTTGRPRGAIVSFDPIRRGDPGANAYVTNGDGVSLYYVPAGLNPADFTLYQTAVV